MLPTGIGWEDLPLELGCGSGVTCWRRLRDWQEAGVWDRLRVEVLRRLRGADRLDFSRVCMDSSSIAAKKVVSATGPNPTDRGKPGTNRHLVTDRQGILLAVRLTGANVHDSKMFEEMLDAIPAISGKLGRPRSRPEKCHADKGYDYPRCREACRIRRIVPRIARRGVESSEKLGKHRWVVERSFAWLNRFRRLTIRYGRRADFHYALTSLACSVICLQTLHHRF